MIKKFLRPPIPKKNMSSKTAHRLAIGGAVSAAISFILGFVGIPYLLNSQIKKVRI